MIHLVVPDLALVEHALRGDDALATALGHAVVPGWATFREALGPARDHLADDPDSARWGTRFFVTDDPRELVGWGGFKGAPHDGAVELGYEIAESRRERGLATAATHAMLAEAFADPAVERVVAHALPEPNASGRVLVRTGFTLAGAVTLGDEAVWRYVTTRPVTP